MMGMKTIYNRMFLKHFMYTFYEMFNDKCSKNVIKMNIIMSEQQWGKSYIFNIFLMLFTNENIIFV